MGFLGDRDWLGLMAVKHLRLKPPASRLLEPRTRKSWWPDLNVISIISPPPSKAVTVGFFFFYDLMSFSHIWNIAPLSPLLERCACWLFPTSPLNIYSGATKWLAWETFGCWRLLIGDQKIHRRHKDAAARAPPSPPAVTLIQFSLSPLLKSDCLTSTVSLCHDSCAALI